MSDSLNSSSHPGQLNSLEKPGREHARLAGIMHSSDHSYWHSLHLKEDLEIYLRLLCIVPSFQSVQDFITQIKTTISRLHEVGIELPKDIIAYLILNKLPPSTSNISQQITHSEKEITPELVLDHLQLYMNDQQFVATNSSSKTVPTSLHTEESWKCTPSESRQGFPNWGIISSLHTF
ncbi:hypothetical protein VP01_9377g1, partial [Puccinia sorghi]